MKKVKEVRETEKSLRRELGRKPRRQEISAKLDKSIRKVDEVLQFNLKEVSLDEKIGREKDTPISDYLVDQKKISPEDDLIKRESSGLVRSALSVLNDQERLVVRHRFGLGGGRVMTLKEIGEKMGISRERVRQIEAQAKGRLRKAFKRPISTNAPAKRIYPNRALKARTNL
jgi:RNA polymerase sigma factor (sigma-70 family)